MPLLTQPYHVEHGIGLAQRGARLEPGAGPAEERTHRGVLANRHRGERPDDLERPPDAESRDSVRSQPANGSALPADVARIQVIEPADAVEQCRFAGTVRPDDAQDVALLNGEADVGQRIDAAKSFADVAQRQQAHALVSRNVCRKYRSESLLRPPKKSITPRGMKITQTASKMPRPICE